MPRSEQIPSDAYVDVNFKMPSEWRYQFRVEAAKRGMSGKALLEAAFALFLENSASPVGEPRKAEQRRRLSRQRRPLKPSFS